MENIKGLSINIQQLEEKIINLTPKEFIMSMVEGLLRPAVKIDMGTFGEIRDHICFGCAATNGLCYIAGGFSYEFMNQEHLSLRTPIMIKSKVIGSYEMAIDNLRCGCDVILINSFIRSYGGSMLKVTGEIMPVLTQDNYQDKEILQKFINYANFQES